MSKCEYVSATHHSDDLIEVYSGSTRPFLFCGYHALPAWIHFAIADANRHREVYVLWFGGSNYAASYIDDNLERFENLQAAEDALSRRTWAARYPATFYPVDKEPYDTLLPTVEGSSMTVWYYDPRGEIDPYPDLILEQGTDEDSEIVEVTP